MKKGHVAYTNMTNDEYGARRVYRHGLINKKLTLNIPAWYDDGEDAR